MFLRLIRAALLLTIVLNAPRVFAEDPQLDDLNNLTLEDLLNQKVTVASQKATASRSAPGIVTVVTAEEIRQMGARDLIDVLYMVPGFNFNGDIYTTDGLAVRGIYATEGRALFILDGIMLNETLYGNVPLFGRLAVDQIEKIEIIRGAGSAIYGGFAALAVINITTKGAAGKDRCEVDALGTAMASSFGHAGLGGLCRRTLGPVALDFAIHSAQANRSVRGFSNYDTATGTEQPIDLRTESRTRDLYMNAGVQAYGFKLRGLVDQYTVPSRSMYGTEALPQAYDTHFFTYGALASYDFDIKNKVRVTPFYSYKLDTPWQVKNLDTLVTDPAAYFDVRNIRTTTGIKASYDLNDDLNVLLGTEYMEDHAHTSESSPVFKTGTRDLACHSIAVYGQFLMNTPYANLALGARFEDHSAFDPAFVPRIALTRQMGPWHVKALWSKAYRNPSVSNINSFDFANYSLKPEKTNDLEIEGGYQYNSTSQVTLNLFDERITDSIIYVSTNDSYITAPHLGTQGFELEHRMRAGWGFANLSYSFYHVTENDVINYKVEKDHDALLGSPQHKVTGLVNYRLNDKLSLVPSLVFLGPNWTNSYDRDSGGGYTEQKLKPVLLANLNFTAADLFGLRGFAGSLGMFNILDQHHKFVLAYRSAHEDIPGPSRDIVMHLGYTRNF